MILVWDTETTGLTLHPDAPVEKQPKIIEWGGALLSRETGEVVRTHSIIIHPGEQITEEITKITGLTNDDLKGQPRFRAALPGISEMFSAATAHVAHNLPFDRAVLSGELVRNSVADFPWPAGAFCTVGMYKEVWGRNVSMRDLYQWVVGEPLAQTHRALDDVMALVKIIQTANLWRMM